MFVPENSLGDGFFVILEDGGQGGGEEHMGKVVLCNQKEKGGRKRISQHVGG